MKIVKLHLSKALFSLSHNLGENVGLIKAFVKLDGMTDANDGVLADRISLRKHFY